MYLGVLVVVAVLVAVLVVVLVVAVGVLVVLGVLLLVVAAVAVVVPTIAAPDTYGCSLRYIRLQPPIRTVAGAAAGGRDQCPRRPSPQAALRFGSP